MVTSRQLEAVPLEEALDRWMNELEFRGLANPGPTEEIGVMESLWRVTARPVSARRPSPHYYAAAVDGLAVKSTLTFGATVEKPVRVKLGKEGTFVDPGRPLPDGFDTVVPLTEVTFINVEEVGVTQPSAPWRNVSPTGEDMHASEVVVPASRRVRPPEIAAMLRGGVPTVTVRQRPRIGLVPIGSNLIPPGTDPGVGQRVETNTVILGNWCRMLGAEPIVFDIVPEKLEDLTAALSREKLDGLDMLVLISGRSHGTALPAEWIGQNGTLILYGANIKPGHSIAAGAIEKFPVFGLPGNAVSAYITFDLFVRPLILRRQGLRDAGRIKVSAVLGQGIQSAAGSDEFLRVTLTDVAGRRVAIPISRGADIVTSLVRAQGILHVPADVEQIPDGTFVQVGLMEPDCSFEGGLLVMGTYDIAFDLLRNALGRRYSDVFLQTANVGSTAGMKALKKGYCHAAALHLFDDATGTYNETHVREFMPELPVVLVNFFRRNLGFIVKKGNPKNIKTFQDLERDDVTFINRQHGSGTRVLIDHHLRKNGVDATKVKGYGTETYTHMSLAATVAGGAADVGIGIAAVARSMEVDFVPLISEHLDLCIPRRHLQSYPMQCLLGVLRSAEFKAEVEGLMHYDTTLTGKVVYEGGGPTER
jgi:putative molybdopterin biosynthesis protein